VTLDYPDDDAVFSSGAHGEPGRSRCDLTPFTKAALDQELELTPELAPAQWRVLNNQLSS
jgi:hypothetical protein